MSFSMYLMKVFFPVTLYSILLTWVFAHEGEASKPFQMLHLHDAIDIHAHGGWESRYALEGRDSLDGGSLWSSSVEASYDHFFGGLWYGRSSRNDFRELHLGVGVIQRTENMEYYISYTHLLFPVEEISDSEWGAGFSYDALPFGLASGLDLVYSVDAKGSFFEWTTSKSVEISDLWESSFGTALGWNQDFVSDGHDGWNHISLNANGRRALSDRLGLVFHGAQSWAINRDLSFEGDVSLKDFFHFGVSLEAQF